MLEKFMLNKKTDKSAEGSFSKEDIDLEHVPKHIAIIMDGNGRWAKKRGLPRVAGHNEGMNVIRRMVRLATTLGIEALSLYAFSTENWKRPPKEVEFLMKLPQKFLTSFLPELIELNVQVRTIGDRTGLPEYTLTAVDNAIEQTKDNDGLILNFALNYGSRTEILSASKQLARQVKEGVITEEEINEELFEQYLMTRELPDPDLLIRTSGEIRLSNFMLWQLAYAEFWFTKVLWPDFKEEHFVEAICAYQQRGRRFGGV
ncbi:isoprenyl transferase [Bacillus tianshenii]|nr:isoprenyl transferase [Bacillus tianshenii]